MPVAPVEPSAHHASAPPPEGYTIQHGDTLSGIADAHGVSLQALEAANPQILHPDLIFAGQHVNIPERGAGGDSGAPHEVTVKAGDTLSGIAGKLGVDWRTMAQVNHLSNPNLIRPGEVLRVPGEGGGKSSGGAAVSGSGPVASGGSSQKAYDIARSYLGQNASSLKVNGHDRLPMDPNVSSDECCANFVSAVLVQAGELPASAHTDSVQQLKTTLENRGWQRVDAAHAQPGDVVIMQRGISHTEMVADGGRMIGSNNTNADGSQRVGYNPLSYAAQHGGIILRPPGGASAPSKPAPSAGAGGVGPASGGEAGRRQQAVSYFESHGWTHAQAAGIAANLQTESRYNAAAVGDGGSAYGIGQWHPDRQALFQQHFGHSIKGASYGEQLEFVNYELHHSEGSAGRRLGGATSASEAGAIVSRYYERPADASGEAARRGALAGQIAGETH